MRFKCKYIQSEEIEITLGDIAFYIDDFKQVYLDYIDQNDAVIINLSKFQYDAGFQEMQLFIIMSIIYIL